MKTKVLILVVLVASIAMFATGAFAYFTTSAQASGNIKSGTFDLNIAAVVPSADCPTTLTLDSVTLWDLENIAPGDVITGKLCMQNTGTVPITQVGFNWTGMAGTLADHLFVTKLYNSLTGDEIGAYIATLGGTDGKLSLTELGARGGDDEYWVGGVPVFLPVGTGVQWVEYTFVFDPDAGNEFQNLNFDYNLAISGYQFKKY